MTSETRLRARPRSAIRSLLKSEAGGGIVLMASAALALAVANSPWADTYFTTLELHVGGLSIRHWVNDGLMALFFLLVGLEIKRELLDGQLARWPDRLLPGIAALGGMIVPASIYVVLNIADTSHLRGWAIPAATDIAFALGVLALLGSRVPVSLKLFLTALAILDDMGAVVIIALFYTADLNIWAILGAGLIFSMLRALNAYGFEELTYYLVLGAALWVLVLLSGVHATIAGVLLAMVIPLRRSPGAVECAQSPLHRLEHALQRPVAFLILPIFGFANAGLSLSGIEPTVLQDPIVIGIIFGLFLGKQVGVFASTWIASRMRLVTCPAGATWTQVYGVSVLCGIGFTMSLFIALLAFPGSTELEDRTKIGVLLGSLASAIFGWAVLRVASSGRTTRLADVQP
jgi:Na+:H+ antiporter, NhaA family